MDQDRQRAKELFKEMSFPDKVEHLIRNYGVTAIVIAIVCYIVVMFIGNFTFNKAPDKVVAFGFHAKVLDTDLASEVDEKLTERYPEYLSEKTAFYSYWFYNGYSKDQTEQISTTKDQLAGMIMANQLDILIGDLDTLSADAEAQYLVPLSKVFSEEELEWITARLAELGEEAQTETGITLLSFDIGNDSGRTQSRYRDEPFLLQVTGCSDLWDDTLMNTDVYIGFVNGSTGVQATKELLFDILGIEHE